MSERAKLYSELENERHSKVIVYATSTRQGMEAQIAKDILPKFVEHLDRIGRSNRISLVLYTNGVYNPTRQLPNGASMPLPVSVESVMAYMEMAKNDFNIKDQKYLTEIFLKLSEKNSSSGAWRCLQIQKPNKDVCNATYALAASWEKTRTKNH